MIKNIHQDISIRLTPDIRLRREYFGGLVYDTHNGNMIEVDKSTFQFLNLIKDKSQKINDVLVFLLKKKLIKKSYTSVNKTVQKLFELKIIEESKEPASPFVFNPQKLKENKYKSWLSAPETLHWAVTYRCDKNCPDCYSSRFYPIKNELNTSESLKLIDKIAKWNVFQLAIGGGEPFTRKDLPQLIHHAATQGLTVHLTTGKLNIDLKVLESLSPFIKNIQFGIKSAELISTNHNIYIQEIQNMFIHTQRLGIAHGTNVFLNRSVIKKLEYIITILIDIGVNRITLLRYKPPENIDRWKHENPETYQMKELQSKITKIIKKNPHLKIRVDCALSFIQRNLPEKIARKHGIKGCVAADRILAVSPDGSVYPCSQLVHPRFNSGNLLHTEPEMLWNDSKILLKYRSFHTKKTFTHSWCGVCRVKKTCGGCRVFAMDGLGGDPGCPEPLLPTLNQIGKIGRNLDLIEYLEHYLTISVGEYMERYGVGQKKAIRELNASPYTISTTGKPVRKKKDTFEYVKDDIIQDIQDSIGYTPGGFPFASYEEISEWIETPSSLGNYPKWINK